MPGLEDLNRQNRQCDSEGAEAIDAKTGGIYVRINRAGYLVDVKIKYLPSLSGGVELTYRP